MVVHLAPILCADYFGISNICRLSLRGTFMPHLNPATVLLIAVVALVVGAVFVAAGLTFITALLA